MDSEVRDLAWSPVKMLIDLVNGPDYIEIQNHTKYYYKLGLSKNSIRLSPFAPAT